jgi:long-chain acyl-CoA synthetase
MKVRKNAVSDGIRQSLSHRPENQQTAASPLEELLSRVRGKAAGKVTSASRLGQDMDLDSLARVELMSAVEERFGVDLDEQAFTSAETVGDLERLIRLDDTTSEKAPAFTFPRWPLRFPVSTFRIAFYYLLILPITRILCRVKVRGRKRIEDLPGPVLLAANHVTEIDAVIIMSALPHRFRSRLAIAMDGERLMGYRHPGAGTNLITRLRLLMQYVLVVSLFNVFPLPRRSGFRRSFEFAGEAMDAGHSVLIFPEGEMTKDGDLHAFRSGVGILAVGLEAPVVPVSVTGLYEQKAAGRRLYVPAGSVVISIGDPISFDANQSAASVVRELEQKFEKGF